MMALVRLRPWIGSVLLLPALLAGCARYVPRPIKPAATASELSARRLDDPKLARFLAAMGHPERRWTITTLTFVAVYERPELRVAHAKYALARGALTSASAIPNPVLVLSPTYNAAAGLPSPIMIGPVIDFLISSFGARSASMAAARSDIAASRAAIQTVAWQERGRVRDALLGVWQTRMEARLAERSAVNATASLTVQSQRFTAGLVSAPELNLARLSAEQAHFAATEAVRRRRLAMARLAGAIGMPKSALRGIKLDLSVFNRSDAPADLPALARAALVDRPAVRAALARYAAAQDRLRAAIDRQYPAFTIGPGYHYDQGDNKFILALSLPLPVFNQNQGPIAIARARRRLAGAQFQAVQQRVLDQIVIARTDWRASEAADHAAEQAVRTAERAEGEAKRAFHAGATGRLRLLGARQAAILARQNALVAQTQARVALGQLEDALHHRFFGGQI